MAVALLKLDKDCAMPTILRRKWWENYKIDPVRALRNGYHLMRLALLFLAAVLVALVFMPPGWPTGLLLFGLLALAVTACVDAGYKISEANKFAAALDKLSLALDCGYPVASLFRLNIDELMKLADGKMFRYVRTLRQAEIKYAKEVNRGANRDLLDELAADVACRRQEFKDAHMSLLAFGLVAEQWDSYFAEIEKELTAEAGKKPANANESDV